MSKYILAHDLGTSGNKATLYDFDGKLCSSALYEYPTYYPDVNWVEQEPEDWWKAVCLSTREMLEKAGVDKKEVACVTFSGQMMGCLPVDGNGNPLRKMIIWADMRAVKQSEFIEQAIGMEQVYRTTGHRVSSSYSAAKLLWIKDNEPEIYNKTHKVLHAKDYIVFKLTGRFVTDFSDASGMNLFDINRKVWSEEIVRELGLDKNMLPETHPSTDVVGAVISKAADEIGLMEGTPVVIGGGDGCCAATGAGAVEEGKTYNVVGTSSWIALASKKPIYDDKMRTFNWVHLDPQLYSPCGTMQSAGYSLSWMKNTLCGLETFEAKAKGISPYRIIDSLVDSSPPGANQLLFLPYLLGERSPRWNPDAKGAFIGLKMTNGKEDIYRAVLEGVAFNLRVILEIFSQAVSTDEVIVIGGGAKSKTWLQILSDVWQKPLVVPEFLEEATSMGAAVCGGVGIGVFPDFKVVNKFNTEKTRVIPRKETAETYNKLYRKFNDAYHALMPIFEDLSN